MLLSAPFHRQNLCGDRSNTDRLADYILDKGRAGIGAILTDLHAKYSTV